MSGAPGADGAGADGADVTDGDHVQLHASAVAVDGRGCLITGASGAGKSALAIEMIALGAELVADDRVDVRRAGGGLMISAPPAIAGLIEARGVGILRLDGRIAAPLALIVDLDRAETERLPDPRRRDVLGLPCRLVLGRARAGLAALAVVLLRAGLSVCPPNGPARGSA
jgi:HPr kinase/phosphorylase